MAGKRIIKGATIVVLALCAALISVPAFADEAFLSKLKYAEGNIKVADALKVNTGVSIRLKSNDNIYDTASNEESDLISVLNPAILLMLESQRNALEVGFSADITKYNDNSELDFTERTLKGAYSLETHGGVLLDVSGKSLYTEEPNESQGVPTRTPHEDITIESGLEYLFPAKKLSAKLFYSQYSQGYEAVAQQTNDRDDKSLGVGVYYRFLPKTSVFGKVAKETRDYATDPSNATDADGDVQSTQIGIKWDATAKIVGEVTTGIKKKEYDHSNYSTADESVWGFSGNVTMDLTSATKLNLVLLRSIEETTYSGDTTYSAAGHFIKTGAGIGIKSMIQSKVNVSANAKMEQHEYAGIDSSLTDRSDDVLRFDVGADYSFSKWFSLGAKYEMKSQDSNDPTNDRDNNIITVSLSMLL